MLTTCNDSLHSSTMSAQLDSPEMDELVVASGSSSHQTDGCDGNAVSFMM